MFMLCTQFNQRKIFVKNFQIFWISLHVLDTRIDCTIEKRHKPPPVTNIEFLAQMVQQMVLQWISVLLQANRQTNQTYFVYI